MRVDCGNRCQYLVVAFMATVALLFTALANFWCQTTQLEPIAFGSVATLRFGLFSYAEVSSIDVNFRETTINTQQQCSSYPDRFNFDGFWKSARAFAIIGFLFGAVITLFLWLVPCLKERYSDSIWKLCTGLLLVWVPLCQGLVFLMLQSNMCRDYPATFLYDDRCSLGVGGYLNIVCIILWFLTGGIMAFMGPP